MRGSRFVRGIAVVLAAALAAISAGCFGKFQLTRKVYEINRSIDEKYVRSATTWVFVLVPVYGFAGLLDFLIFNVIEFWSGENPVAAGPVTRTYALADREAVLTLSRDGSATVAVIERYEGGRLVSTLRIQDDGTGKVSAVETAAGKKAREIEAAAATDGSVAVTTVTASGVTTERFASSAVRVQSARAARIASEISQAPQGASGADPLAAAARVPAYGG